MAVANTVSITFIGFGEVGQTFARGLLERPEVRIAAYDILFDDARGDQLKQRAAALGVTVARTGAEAAAGADIIFSAVTASEVEAVASAAAAYVRKGQTFVDVNSAAPETKKRAAQIIRASGADYLEAAVMAPVLKPGVKVPILSGGPVAVEVSERLNRLGMNLTPVASDYGRASAMKLCRSIMIKGIEALIVDCSAASAKWGVTDQVFGSLDASYPSINWLALAADMNERVATHGVRRSAEMREAGEMLEALGMNPELAFAVADAQLRGARKKPA